MGDESEHLFPWDIAGDESAQIAVTVHLDIFYSERSELISYLIDKGQLTICGGTFILYILIRCGLYLNIAAEPF